MSVAPSRISLLPEHLIDQIKAGEVIERPGNLIKEILENSIDAGASRLELILRNNGLDLISLRDNGHGINPEDLPLAFSRHATSKISRFEDLYRLHSFGFRGEALASMAAISRLQCVSFVAGAPEGAEIRIEGGVTTFLGPRTSKGNDRGTEMVIQDLFYNTPVRLKFIQSQQSERNFIRKVIFSFVVAHPQIEFVIKFDDEEKEIHPPRTTLRERLGDLMPKAKDAILHTQRNYEDSSFELHLIPGSFRSPVKLQYALVNGRFVLDKQLLRVISNSLISTFGTDEFHFVAQLTLPPDHIDVNVHPNKTIIKIFETSKTLSLITSTIKELSAPTQRPQSSPQQEATFPFADPAREAPTLQQERHQYNMEGHFSPHRLMEEKNNRILWVGQYMLKEMNGTWEAISAPKLIQAFITNRLDERFVSIPLLVSEPFRLTPGAQKKAAELNRFGIELEKLGPETLVLRSIPDWLNGFPLREVIQHLLESIPLENLQVEPNDWSQSTWEDMLEKFSLSELRELRISTDLGRLLGEKLK